MANVFRKVVFDFVSKKSNTNEQFDRREKK